jgi:ketosteroid isomerase-like protein
MASQPTVTPTADVESVVRRYYEVVADLSSDVDDLEPLLAPEFRLTEHPNAISPNGAVRNRDATIAGFMAGKNLLREQSFDVHEIVVAGDRAAARLTWRGVVGVDAGPLAVGQELVAEIASFLTVRDGRVVDQETFDCYEPLAQSASSTE